MSDFYRLVGELQKQTPIRKSRTRPDSACLRSLYHMTHPQTGEPLLVILHEFEDEIFRIFVFRNDRLRNRPAGRDRLVLSANLVEGLIAELTDEDAA